MKDLALHIMDISQNALRAGATRVEIRLEEDRSSDTLRLCIRDNGRGIAAEMLPRVTDPYTTSRTTRKVGMGLPLLRQNAEQCNGSLSVESEEGKGCTVCARFSASHIDLPPYGDLPGVIFLLIVANPEIDFRYERITDSAVRVFDTREVREVLEDLPLDHPEVRGHLKSILQAQHEEIQALKSEEKI
jgi:anti-sigma regulatory factor (Ser/Thr protein kinase)